jgi:DNA-binding NarL/FixJ family response regulator
MIRILIADDHELLRRGLKGILREAFPEALFAEATTAGETLEALMGQTWDLLLLDIHLPGRSGLEILQELRRHQPRLPVVVLTASAEEDYALRAFRLGASAYVSKQSASSELLVAVRKALEGGRYVTPHLAERLAEAVAGITSAEPHQSLSNREFQVLRLIAQGRTMKEIAAELSLSERTIGTYRTRISQKMRLATNVELTRYAVQHKLVD